MFGPRSKEDETDSQEHATPLSTSPAQQPRTATPAVARRVVDMPGSRNRSSSHSDGEKKLTVGKGLSLAGEITSCDVLVVEGKVEAKLSDGKLLEIAESGQFRGSVEIENADIAGRYDGQLVVHGRLTVRSTGRISGMVKYGELEVQVGGQIIGEVQVAGGGVQAAAGPTGFKNAAKFAAVSEDAEETVTDERKSA